MILHLKSRKINKRLSMELYDTYIIQVSYCYCITNTTGYTCGPKRLLAISSNKKLHKLIVGLPTNTIKFKEVCPIIYNNTLAHSKWNYKYHTILEPKYIIYGKIKSNIGDILRKLCYHKGGEIIEVNACNNPIHIFVNIPPKLSVA